MYDISKNENKKVFKKHKSNKKQTVSWEMHNISKNKKKHLVLEKQTVVTHLMFNQIMY